MARVHPNVDLQALSFALRAQERGSFRKAAQEFSLPTSVVSRRIRSLEDKLGVGLFNRQVGGAKPTEAGSRVLSRAREIMGELDDLVRTAARRGSGEDGRLRVGIVSSIAGGTARELLEAFLTAHPGVELEIIEGSPRDHISEVRALRMDATLVVDKPEAAGCEIEPLWTEPVLVVLPDQHPLASRDSVDWRDLTDEHFIVSEVDPGPEIHDFVVRNLSTLGRHPIIEPRPVRRDSLMAMVGLGRGISLVGAAEASVSYPRVVFRTLHGETLPFSVVWSAHNDNPVLRRFLSLARLSVRAMSRSPARQLRASADVQLQMRGRSP